MTPLFTITVQKSARTGTVKGKLKVHQPVEPAELEMGLLGVLRLVAAENDRWVEDLLDNLRELSEAN